MAARSRSASGCRRWPLTTSPPSCSRNPIPAICAGTTKYSLKIVRQWARERRQWGQELGRHDPVAQKIALIAGTAFGLEAMVDVSARMADDKRRDFRIEAAIAKLYAS